MKLFLDFQIQLQRIKANGGLDIFNIQYIFQSLV